MEDTTKRSSSSSSRQSRASIEKPDLLHRRTIRDLTEERPFVYMDQEEWASLPLNDRVRIAGYSASLFKAFRPTMYLLHGLGLFPFTAKKLNDGSYMYKHEHGSTVFVIFLVLTFFISIVSFLFSAGFIMIFLGMNPGGNVYDRCGNTWGAAVISRNLPAIIFIWSQLMVASAGSLFMLANSASFQQFYNVVNEAVMQLDCEANTGIIRTEIRNTIIFCIVYFIYFLTFCLGDNHSLEEVTFFVAQCLVYFFEPDLYRTGEEDLFDVIDYEELLLKCDTVCKDCYGSGRNEDQCTQDGCYNQINKPNRSVKGYKWLGFFIITYSFLASRTIIHQFEFFCQVLINIASVWNKRFLNYASRDTQRENIDDQFRRRIMDQELLTDHFQIVKLYDVAEENFSFILFVYYTTVFFCLIVDMYYTALLTTQVTCATAVGRERAAAKANQCFQGNAQNPIDVNQEILNFGMNRSEELFVSFEDACSIKQKDIIDQASFSSLLLFVITMTTFIMTTILADRASHQADIGFYRVRRKGYLGCRTKAERHTMHALVFSFTGPKPFAITASKFFLIKKKTIIVLTSVAFIYFLIILSFKPGMNASSVRCYELGPKNETVFVVKYPKVFR